MPCAHARHLRWCKLQASSHSSCVCHQQIEAGALLERMPQPHASTHLSDHERTSSNDKVEDAPSTSGSGEGAALQTHSSRRFRSSRVPGVGVFLLMDQAKQAARKLGREVIDLSVGASDLRPPPEALEALKVRARVAAAGECWQRRSSSHRAVHGCAVRCMHSTTLHAMHACHAWKRSQLVCMQCM